jgi:parallel beta-helix repeat protein
VIRIDAERLRPLTLATSLPPPSRPKFGNVQRYEALSTLTHGTAFETTSCEGSVTKTAFLTNFSNASIRDNHLIGNGASGIFVGGRSTAVVEHNDISGSRDFGVAIDRSSSAQVFENRIVENVQPGVDLGLDGPTLDGTPRITFARFNAATGETVIEGVVTLNPTLIAFVTNTAYIYANTRDEAGGEIFLGTAVVDANGKFTLRYRGDLTGKYIDAMKYQVTDFGDLIVRESSEFGARVRVFV